MYILGIDTSSNILTVTLSDDDKILTEIHSDKKMGLLENLAPTVEEILYENSIENSDLGAVCVSLGPGSFTGLRIGIAFAKALAYSLNIPIIGVPTLKAMAKCVENPFVDYICPIIFARVNEVYCSIFSGDLKEKILDYTFMTIEELISLDYLKGKKVLFLGTGTDKFKDLILSNDFIISPSYCNFARGMALNVLAYEIIKNNDFDDVKSLVPMYIKKPTPVIRKENQVK